MLYRISSRFLWFAAAALAIDPILDAQELTLPPAERFTPFQGQVFQGPVVDSPVRSTQELQYQGLQYTGLEDGSFDGNGEATFSSASDESVGPSGSLEALQKRIDALEKAEKQRLDAEKKAAEKKKSDDKAKDSKAGAAKADDKKVDDVWQDMSSDKWNVKLGGHVQSDYVTWAQAPNTLPAPGPTNYFEFRRLRLVAEGTGYGVFDFRLQMTLEPINADTQTGFVPGPDVKDAYLSMNDVPVFGRLRVGNFFVPFGLEQVTNDTNNIFMERSIPTQGVFCADREVGIASYKASDNQRMTFSNGVFFDSIPESFKVRVDDNQGYRLSSRLTWLPYYDEPSNGRYLLHTGIGVLHTDDQDNQVRFQARPQIHQGPRMIDSGVLDADSYTTGNLELASVWGSFSIQSEAYVSNVNMNVGNNVNVQGAYVHTSYFLTGENRVYERFGQHGAQFGRNVPHSNFFIVPGGFGPGAWEAKMRWSYLDLNNLDRGQYNDVTTGLNWYWTDRMRVMFDWIHPFTSSQTTIGTTRIGAVQADILAMRMDFNW